MWKSILLLNLLLFSLNIFSQQYLAGTVIDSVNGNPVPFCNIGLKGTTHGSISNMEGKFSILISNSNDTLIVSSLGYNLREISVTDVQKNPLILLSEKTYQLQTFDVIANSDFLYDIILNSAKFIRNQKERTETKVYYSLVTQTREFHRSWDMPVEFVEMYYNGSFKGLTLNDLKLKNGRAALAIYDNTNFFNYGTSRIFKTLDLVENSNYLPHTPFQYSKSQLKKIFQFKLESSDNEYYLIKFTPVKYIRGTFSGEALISKKDWSPVKIKLSINDAGVHPFLPFWEDDSISNMNMDFTYYYSQRDDSHYLDHIEFSFSLDYHGKIYQKVKQQRREASDKTIRTSGLLFCYDQGNPFILPRFDYDNNLSDYQKLQVIPYNDFFWNSTELLLTSDQIKTIKQIAENGELTNFSNLNSGTIELGFTNKTGDLYVNDYLFWNQNKRLTIKNFVNTGEVRAVGSGVNIHTPMMIDLRVDFMLDINPDHEGYNCKTYAVFDPFKSEFHYRPETYTNPFLNLYFDICEIERRKMQAALDQQPLTLNQIDSIYFESYRTMKVVTQKYLAEVNLGKDQSSMKKWNKYIIDNLGIDNLKIFEELNSQKQKTYESDGS